MDFSQLSEGDRFVNSKPKKSWYEIKDGKVLDCYEVDGEVVTEELSEMFLNHFKTIDSWVKI